MNPSDNRLHAHQSVRGILGLGAPAADGSIRIAEGNHFRILLGDEQSHEAMLDICMRLNRALEAEGLDWERLDRSTFTRLLRQVADTSDDE